MTVNRRTLVALLCALLGTAAVASAAAASQTSTPGVTKHKIVIGGTFPLSEGPNTGGASLYKTIPFAEEAYYAYVNARGGVFHRKIVDKVLDDQYDPSETVPQTTKLVEQDHIFADVGSLGTAPGLSTWGYLNKHKVPQVLLATGDAYWGQCVHHSCPASPTPKPWTMGWQPDYPGEGRLYGKYVLKHKPNAKIGVLYQNDAYGKNYLSGLKAGLGKHQNLIVDAEAYNVGNTAQVQAGVVALKAHGADTFVVFATPGASIAGLATASAIGWSPLTFLNNVSANRIFMLKAGQVGAKVNGVISTTYVASQTVQANLKAMKLAKKIIHKYAPTGVGTLDAQFASGDQNLVYGLAVGWTFVDALRHAGKNPTRASLMHALRNLKESGKNQNPFVYPHMTIKTSSKRTFPMEQLVFIKWKGGASGDWHGFGGVVDSGH